MTDRSKWHRFRAVIKVSISVVAAFLLGFFGLSLLFGDLGPEETIVERTAVVVLFYALTGFLFGVANPRHWKLAGLLSWGALLMGAGAVMANLGRPLIDLLAGLIFFLLLPLVLLAAYIGRRLYHFVYAKLGSTNGRN